MPCRSRLALRHDLRRRAARRLAHGGVGRAGRTGHPGQLRRPAQPDHGAVPASRKRVALQSGPADVAQIQYQIAANAAQQKITARDLEVQQTTLAQNEAMDAFLKNKFSTKSWAGWRPAVGAVLPDHQLALDLSRSVQRAYQYELNSDTSFVNRLLGWRTPWPAGRRRRTMLALNQMEKAYLDGNNAGNREDRVLLQLNRARARPDRDRGMRVRGCPKAVRRLPGTTCKIKTVAVSSPRHRPLPEPARHADPAEQPGHRQARPERDQPPAGRQRRQHAGQLGAANSWCQPGIALSRGLADNGMFEGSAADDRYLPEGTGAVSSWRLSLPRPSNRFDFRSITERGAAAAPPPSTAAPESCARTSRGPPCAYAGTDFCALAQRYSNDWFQFLQQPAPGARRCPSHWPTWCRITSTGPC